MTSPRMQAILDARKGAAPAPVAVAAAPATAPAAATVTPTISDGDRPDFNSHREVPAFEELPWIDWPEILTATAVLDSFKDVRGRNGSFYCATLTIVECDNPKYTEGSKWQFSFHYRAGKDLLAKEEQRNQRSFRDIGNLIRCANGIEKSDQSYDLNKAIAKAERDSAVGGSLDLPFIYKQEAYTSEKTGKSGVGRDFEIFRG